MLAESRRSPNAVGGHCTSPRQTAPELECQVVALRLRYPDWGARKLRVLMGEGGIPLPASTIHRILLRHALVQEKDQHRPAPQRFERATPNELWQMDFKGPKSWHQPVGPPSVLDDHSHYVVALEAHWAARMPSRCACGWNRHFPSAGCRSPS